jgi:hypothetical protein
MFIEGTFKCCPKFFEQLYTIHGYSNGHYIPLVFALLVSKSEDTYHKFLQHVRYVVTIAVPMYSIQLFKEFRTAFECPINENFFPLSTEYTKIRSSGENNDKGPQRVQCRALVEGPGGLSSPEALGVWGITDIYLNDNFEPTTPFLSDQKNLTLSFSFVG